MINAIDVLRVLEVFKTLKATPDIPEDTKKLIAGELLNSVPHEIMAPGSRVTSETVRNILREYITDGNRSRKAEEARPGPKEGPSSSESLPTEDLKEVERPRNGGLEVSSGKVMGRPRVEGQETGADEDRKGSRKATRRT